MSKTRKIVIIISCVVLLAGIGIMAFPYLQQWVYDRSARSIADKFDQWRQEQVETADDTGERIPYLQELYAAMQAYNLDLYKNGQEGFRDAWSYQESSFDLAAWGVKDNMVGYIDIPQMNVKLPIYLGATTENMKYGAVHLTQTSLPIGGQNTNSVIAAHRGYSGAAMFRDIDILEIGDEITITNLWETMVYRVAEIKVIRPNETNEVLIQKGRDLVTLITCHPYRYNYQRYVVYCERVDD